MSQLITVIIPVYNEQDTVVRLLDRLSQVKFGCESEFLIIDDGSTDRSCELIKLWLAASPEIDARLYSIEHAGKGAAVRCGIRHSRGDAVIVQDADLEYDPRDIVRCVEPILAGKSLVVYGSRELGEAPHGRSSWAFYLGGKLVTGVFNLFFGTHLTDEPCCHKAFAGDLIRNLEFSSDSFAWEPEVTAKLTKLGFSIDEVRSSYNPRHADENKKIKWYDGALALWTIFYLWLRPVGKSAKKLRRLPQFAVRLKQMTRYRRIVWGVVFAALALRVFAALPALAEPETLLRPDSAGYLVQVDYFLHGEETGAIPVTQRVPLYGLFASALAVLFGKSLFALAFGGAVLSALSVIPAAKCGELLNGRRAGVAAAILLALNPTSIGVSVQILSDSLFALLVAWQGLCLLRVWKHHRLSDYVAGVVFAVLATLTRPVNLPVLLVCLPFIAAVNINRRSSLVRGLAATLILSLALLGPLAYRNHNRGAGWVLDVNTGNTLLNNAAAVRARAEGRDFVAVQQELFELAERRSRPGASVGEREKIKSRINYEVIRAYPEAFLVESLPNWLTMTPDFPAMLENLRVTVSGNGTLNVIKAHGVWAGIRHYFTPATLVHLWWMLILGALALVMYVASLWEFLALLCRRQWRLVLTLTALLLPYWALPGPMFMPRYQLPMLALLAALAGARLAKWWKTPELDR